MSTNTTTEAGCHIRGVVAAWADAVAAGARNHTHGVAWCVARPGLTPGANLHPEGACTCFHGGTAPVPARSAAHPAMVAHAAQTAATMAARAAQIEAAHAARVAARSATKRSVGLAA